MAMIDPSTAVQQFSRTYEELREQVSRAIVGQEAIIDGVLTSLLAGGHVLLEGVPGLGKTLLIRSLAEALAVKFNRVQFTPDLMPADIIGTNIITEDPSTGRRNFAFQPGPIFTQVLLADEINRATPKTQSALLEAMQEGQVTSAGTRYELEKPFFVLATQNPLEQEGTYPLPEAQLDRFFFKLVVPFVTRTEMIDILNRTTAGLHATIQPVCDGARLLEMRTIVEQVVVADAVQDYIVRLVLATHPEGDGSSEAAKKYLRCGASPRAAQAITLGAKVQALLAGRYNAAFADVERVRLPALRHRILLNFDAQAEGVNPDRILGEVFESVRQRA